MKPHRTILWIVTALLCTCLWGCHKNKALEKAPKWSAFEKFYQDDEYQQHWENCVKSLNNSDLLFSDQIQDFYQKNNGPVWTANGLQEKLVNQFLDLYSKSEEHGLPTEIFGYQKIKDEIEDIHQGKVKSSEELYKKLAKIETLMARANVLYAKTMLYGATDPKEVNGGKWLYENDSILPSLATTAMEKAPQGTTHLASLHPQDSVYLALQQEMRKYLALREKPWDSIPSITADSGRSATHVHLIGERLLLLKEIADSYTPSDRLDATLMPAINRFRENRGIPTGKSLDQETIDALNKTPQEYINQLAANLERCRWKTVHKKGHDFLAVNIPDFMLEARCADTLALRMKICCGKYKRKRSEDSCRVNGILPALKTESPLLYSEVRSIVLNPEWRIPASIIKDEYYYKMVRNSMGVINKEKLYVVDNRTKKRVLPETIDWKRVSQKNIPYQLIQTSGNHNALGRIKFDFNNTESVYFHDTNNKGAFRNRRRAFSHGCIRVSQPRELADLLFEMNEYDTVRMEQFHIILGDEPTTEEGEEYLEKMQEKEEKYRASLSPEDSVFYRPLRPTNVALRKKMPLFIEYHTAFIGPNGSVHYRPDVYRKDQNILNAIQKLIPSC
jgi:murein L,D-transpeptidase YcbB/YkuD